MNSSRFAGTAGAIAGFLTVLLGAFGAHALAPRLDAHAMEIWRTATLYQGLHSLALLAIACLGKSSRSARIAAHAMLLGLVLFCGSLYALALDAPRWVGIVTPLGGTAWLVGWAALVVVFQREAK